VVTGIRRMSAMSAETGFLGVKRAASVFDGWREASAADGLREVSVADGWGRASAADSLGASAADGFG
jgi:hypothetical protein